MKKLLSFIFLAIAPAFGQWSDFSSQTAATNLSAAMNGKINIQITNGNPNGVLACTAGKDFARDVTNNILYHCEVTGSPSNGWAEVIRANGNYSNPSWITSLAASKLTGLFYQTLKVGGSAATQRNTLNFIPGTNVAISCVDNGGTIATDCTISATAGAGGYTQIMSNGSTTGLTPRSNLNFGTQFGVTDNSAGGRTDVVVSALDASVVTTGALVKARQNAATVYADQANTWTAGAQDFSGAASLRIPNVTGCTPTLNGQVCFDPTSGTYKGYIGASVKTFAMVDGNIATATALAANGTNCGAGSAAAGVDASGNAEGCARYPQIFFGTTAPGSVSGNLPGDLFSDTTNHNDYWCNATSGTAAPACTSVTVGGWTLLNTTGTGGGNVSTSGTPTANTLAMFIDATHIGNSNVLQDATTGQITTAKSLNGPASTSCASGTTGAVTIDTALGNVCEIGTLTGNVTSVPFTHLKAGMKFTVKYTQAATPFTFSYGSTVLANTGCSASQTPGSKNWQDFEVAADGTTVVGKACGSDDVPTLWSGLPCRTAPGANPLSTTVDMWIDCTALTLQAHDPSGNTFTLVKAIANPSDSQVINYIGTDGVQHRIAQSGNNTYCPDTNGADTALYSCTTMSPTPATLTGLLVSFRPQTTNGSCASHCSLTVGSLGTKNLFQSDGITDIATGALVGGNVYNFIYDGNNFRQTSSGGGGTANPASVVTTTFSATPTFTCPSATAGTVTTFKLSTALTANVTSSTLSTCTNGQTLHFVFTQDGTGGRSVVMPSGFDAPFISPTAGVTTTVSYTWDGTNGHLVNQSTDTPSTLFTTERAAPGTPASGTAVCWPDSTDHSGLECKANNSANVFKMVKTGADIKTTTGLVVQMHDTLTSVNNAASPYTVLAADTYILCDATAGAVTINLPAATATGREISVKKTDSSANACTPTRAGSDTIDGATSYSLTTQYASSKIIDAASGVWHRSHVNQLGGDASGISTNAVIRPGVTISTSGPVADPGGSSAYLYNNAAGALTFNLPDGVVGFQRCYRNATGKSGAITIAVTTSNAIDYNGANGTTTTGTLVSGGALGDAVCLVADAAHHWYAYVQRGSWTNN